MNITPGSIFPNQNLKPIKIPNELHRVQTYDHKEGKDAGKTFEEDQASIKIAKSQEIMENSKTNSIAYQPFIESQLEMSNSILDEKREKKLVRKIDCHILPCICLLYMLNHLDRSNIANARIAGMEADLKLSSTDYATVILIFFVGYLSAEIPSNMILPRMRPSLFLPSLAAVWGLLVGLISLVKTKESLIVARFFMGFIESGFFPGVVFLLSSWYQKAELAKRIGILYSFGIISGALSGLISGEIISQLEGVGRIRGWRWLFIIEGCITVSSAIIVHYFFPDWPSNTKWLSDEEKTLATLRLQVGKDLSSEMVANKPSHRESLKAALGDWRTYLFSFMYLMVLSSQTILYFLPTIVHMSLGYDGREAQFMTAPPYLVSCVFTIIVPISMDHFGQEMFHVAIPMAFSGLLYSLCLVITSLKARYVLVCLGFGVSYAAVPVVLAWVINVVGSTDRDKKSITVAIVNTIGNLASLYGSFIWPKTHAPKFVMGFSMISTFSFSGVILALFIKYLLVHFPQSKETTQSCPTEEKVE